MASAEGDVSREQSLGTATSILNSQI